MSAVLRLALAATAVIGLSSLAEADVRVTALSATTVANASGTPVLDPLGKPWTFTCFDSRQTLPPLAEIGPSSGASVSVGCNTESGLTYEAQSRVAIRHRAASPSGLPGPIDSFNLQVTSATFADDRVTNFTGSASNTFSASFHLDSPMVVTVRILRPYVDSPLLIDLAGIEVPVDGRRKELTVVAEPGTFTIAGATSATSTGVGSDHDYVEIGFEFRPLPKRGSPVLDERQRP